MPPPTAPASRTSGTISGRGTPGTAIAVAVAARPPITIWPSPPMFRTFARNAMQIPTPTSTSGTALIAVSASASTLPKAPSTSARYPVTAFAPSAMSMTAPIRSATSAAAGMASQLTRKGRMPPRVAAVRPLIGSRPAARLAPAHEPWIRGRWGVGPGFGTVTPPDLSKC